MTKTSISNDETSVEPQFVREGDQVAFKVVVAGVVTGITSPTMAMYKEGSQSDVSSIYLAGDMPPVAGIDTIVTKTTQNLKAGNWILSISGTVDGQVQNVATIPLIVKRKSER